MFVKRYYTGCTNLSYWKHISEPFARLSVLEPLRVEILMLTDIMISVADCSSHAVAMYRLRFNPTCDMAVCMGFLFYVFVCRPCNVPMPFAKSHTI